MKILILEDNPSKLDLIKSIILDVHPEADLTETNHYGDFSRKANQFKYNLIVVDFLVPLFKDSPAGDEKNVGIRIIEDVRVDKESQNIKTPVIAITGYNIAAEENYKTFNENDICVVTFSDTNLEWKETLRKKVADCVPTINYDFLIICALDKEADGFTKAGYTVEESDVFLGFSRRAFKIGNKTGAIITCLRPGLVSCAITTARAIDIFKPKLVCMSGICAGIAEQSSIFDVIIPTMCHQHDSGKWTDDGFVPEPYPVQIEPMVKLKISSIISKPDFKDSILSGIKKTSLTKKIEIIQSITSSGSSVVADNYMNGNIGLQHRKLAAFEMEIFAVYEAARMSEVKPLFFGAKSVVDNGTSKKGDEYHELGCIISAKVIYELIKRGVAD